VGDALKRIEEKHADCFGCDPLENRKPCDVVKLARALDAIANPNQFLLREAVATGDPARIIQRLTEIMGVMRGIAKRTLEEVAGEH
jgi:hypothetical protein